MSGNTFGRLFTLTTFGESHGVMLGGIVDGCPPGLPLDERIIQSALDKRRPGKNAYTSQRQETDRVQIVSGVFNGVTTGTPIGLLVQNHDSREQDYAALKDNFRPGHADFTYQHKYGIRDHRGGGRASARETVMRVAAGAIAEHYLALNYQIHLRACVEQVGELTIAVNNWDALAENDFFLANTEQASAVTEYIEHLREAGDSCGASILVEACGVPIGLGEPVFDKLDADIAKALMSIPAAKAVGIGSGAACVTMRGSEHNDSLTQNGFASNHAGGVLGGISNGEIIRARVAIKPASSIAKTQQSIDIHGNAQSLSVTGRHDPCPGLRAAPIARAMLALVLTDHLLRHRGQCGL